MVLAAIIVEHRPASKRLYVHAGRDVRRRGLKTSREGKNDQDIEPTEQQLVHVASVTQRAAE